MDAFLSRGEASVDRKTSWKRVVKFRARRIYVRTRKRDFR